MEFLLKSFICSFYDSIIDISPFLSIDISNLFLRMNSPISSFVCLGLLLLLQVDVFFDSFEWTVLKY